MKISVIIPVLNDAAGLKETIDYLRSTTRPSDIEIIAADGGSSDQSLTTARLLADKTVETAPPGRARQMHAGALAASGDILLFLHCDTQLPGGWFNTLRSVWSSKKKPSATAFGLRFESSRKIYRVIEFTARLRTALTGVPHGDQAIAVSRDTYFEIGGYPEVPLMEEYALVNKLKRRGPVLILKQNVLTSPRRYERNGRLWNACRNGIIVSLYLLGVPPTTLKGIYR